MKIILSLLLIFSSIAIAGIQSINDYVGEYSLDLEKTNDSIEHKNILGTVILKIYDDNSIKYGAGKQHILKLKKDLDDTGKAIFIEIVQIANKEYKIIYIFEITSEHLILYAQEHTDNPEFWNYFKINKLPNKSLLTR